MSERLKILFVIVIILGIIISIYFRLGHRLDDLLTYLPNLFLLYFVIVITMLLKGIFFPSRKLSNIAFFFKADRCPGRIFFIPFLTLLPLIILALSLLLIDPGEGGGALGIYIALFYFIIPAGLILLLISLVYSIIWYIRHKKKQVDLAGKVRSEDE